MQVFATKDGKVYKVSLKNFIEATGKKAPYYKRVKKNGEVIEKAYAICSECGNPVHFVNLFSKRKKKKAHARHQRSSIKGLASYDSTAYKHCPFVLGIASPSQKKGRSSKKLSKQVQSFSSALNGAFGFSKKNAELLAEIYLRLARKDSAAANQTFFALLASPSYNFIALNDFIFGDEKSGRNEQGNYKQFGMGLAWNGVGNVLDDESAKDEIVALGFKRNDVEGLFEEILAQHGQVDDFASSYYKKPDFVHLCATMSAVLNESYKKDIGGFIAGSFNGIYSANDNAGYIGDVCGTDGVAPSMNDGDYKSDLDAVNLSTLLSDNAYSSLFVLIPIYYEAIDSGNINRAREFKQNIGMEALDAQREAYYQALWHKNSSPMLNDSEIQKAVESQIGVFDKFIEHIELEKVEWSDEQ